jgi:uncharacterized protein
MSDGKMGNPAPLGLLGFGMTTILLNFHNAGFFPVNSMILAMGIFVGGMAQVLAGIYEWKMGNTFGMAAFTLYGFFWLSFVAMVLLPENAGVEATEGLAKGLYLLIWGIFTFFMFIATLKMTKVHQLIFGSLALLFILLAIGDIFGAHSVIHIAGWVGLVCGFSAFYAAIAQILNEVYGRTVLPM